MSNGKAERMVGRIKNVTFFLVRENPQDWHKHCKKAMHGYQCRHFSHGKSPFELLYGSHHAYPKERWQVIETQLTEGGQ